jgi:hypothetical protein
VLGIIGLRDSALSRSRTAFFGYSDYVVIDNWLAPTAGQRQNEPAAFEAWNLVMKPQKTLMDSIRSAGMPFALAADQYDKLMEFHSKQYKAVLEYMDKMSVAYQQLLVQRKN